MERNFHPNRNQIPEDKIRWNLTKYATQNFGDFSKWAALSMFTLKQYIALILFNTHDDPKDQHELRVLSERVGDVLRGDIDKIGHEIDGLLRLSFDFSQYCHWDEGYTFNYTVIVEFN